MQEDKLKVDSKFQNALQLQQQNKYEEAQQAYQDILILDDTHHDTIVNLAALQRCRGKTKTALKLLDQAVTLYPSSFHARFNLGNLHFSNKNYQLAVEHYRVCAKNESADRLPAFHARFAEVLRYMREYSESIPHYQKACRSDPDNLLIHNNFAEVLIRLEKFNEAQPILERLIKMHPKVMAPLGNLANLYFRCNESMSAIQYYKKALQLEPESTELHKGLGVAYHKALEMQLAEVHLNKAILQGVSDSRVHSNLLYLQSYREDKTSETVFDMHKKWGESTENRLTENDFSHYDYSHDRPLNIGIVSSDLHEHPVVHFILPLYEIISKSRFKVFSYADGHKIDGYSNQLKNLSYKWIEIGSFNDRQLAAHVLSDRIDIVIDLAGHSGSNRIECFATRLAPIQMSYLGYVNTTGLSRIDYRICDSMVNPESTQRFYTENLLPIECFSCYRALDSLPSISEGPAVKNGYITFGSVNNASKLTPGCIELWSKVLQRVKESKLLLKSGQFKDEWVQSKFTQQFAQHGISANRLIFEGPSTPKRKFMEVFEAIDVLLDPFPHNGGTTTHDALSMGVAAICLTGDVYVKRFGYQIMTLSGNTEFIAKTHDDYIDIAVQFAEISGESLAMRQSRRDRFMNSPLTDSHQFVCNVENALRKVWEEKCLKMNANYE